MLNKVLTGNTRYRACPRLFRPPLLVLQVEEREYGWYAPLDQYDTYGLDVDRTYFRDATVEDVLAGKVAREGV